jgi:Ca2+-transporting ATPase
MLNEKDIQSLQGLSNKEASLRLARDGYNELQSEKPRNFLRIAFDVLKEPMLLLLISCGSLYIFIGDVQEALILLSFVFFIIGIELFQEQKTERALESLKDLSSPRALVIREGKQTRIAGREVVVGDTMLLSEGDRVPADALLIWVQNVQADESLLTGESLPVRKIAGEKQEHIRPGGDDLPMVYSGSLIVGGHGIARVLSIGANTEIGKIGKALRDTVPEKYALAVEVDRIIRITAFIAVTLSIIVMTIYGLTKGEWLKGILAGLSVAMSLLPSEFPVIFAVFMALGAWRMSQKNVLTRRTSAIESLGSATVLCVDKTGTLTENQMSVRKIYSDGLVFDTNDLSSLPEDFHQTVEFSVLASQKDPFDPMDISFKKFAESILAGTEHLHHDWSLIREYPLSPELLALSHVWKSPSGGNLVVAAKGAPESILDLCHLTSDKRNSLLEEVIKMSSEGLRVLGIARAFFKESTLPANQHDFDFEFLGFIGLEDPPRKTVSKALKECYAAGIRVVMITGDYPGTAQSIARQVGFKSPENVMTGNELEGLSDLELQSKIRDISVFARVLPEQKLRIVNALKAVGEVVAMTGDGVNDAPALKSANIGIAMGGRGTDVAREAASLVLLNDDFRSIEEAIRMGRRIFDNLRRAMAYTIAVHVPIAGMSLLPVVLGLPLVLLPVHIVFLEMIIDPTCSIVFEAEPEEGSVMNRPPRQKGDPLFTKPVLFLSFLQGILVLLAVFTVFYFSVDQNVSDAEARTMAFTTLIVSNVGLILVNRSWDLSFWQSLLHRNVAFWYIILGAIVFLSLILYVPVLQEIFHFSTLDPNDILICLGAGIASVLWFEILKIVRRKMR